MAIFYIDPTYNGADSNGTIDAPYKSWSQITLSNNNQYLQKRGTSTSESASLGLVNYSDIVFGSYGTGDRPEIVYTGGRSFFDGDGVSNILIQGLKVVNGPTGVINLGAHQGRKSYDNVVRDCEVVGGWRGINAEIWKTDTGSELKGLLIEDCIVHYTDRDGIFVKGAQPYLAKDVTIVNCHIYDVNRVWFTVGEPGGISDIGGSDGDCIHLLTVDNFLVKNCILDRRGTTYKFCFIWGGNFATNEQTSVGGTVEGCTLYSPDHDPVWSSNAIYVNSGLSIFNFRKNRIINRQTSGSSSIGLVKSDLNYFEYNIIDNTNGLTISGVENNFNNNLFNINSGASAILSTLNKPTYLRNNIFIYSPSTSLINDGYNGGANVHKYNNIEATDTNGIDMLKFFDYNSQDYHIMEGSSAINGGIEYPNARTSDFDDNPISGVRDIGPYEYNGVIIPPDPTKYIVLEWAPVNNVDGYTLEVGLPTEKLIVDTVDTFFKLEGVEYDTTYTWKVVPYNQHGEAVNCPTWTFKTVVDPNKGTPPQPTTPVNPFNNQTNVSLTSSLVWNSVNDADGYRLSLWYNGTAIIDDFDFGNNLTTDISGHLSYAKEYVWRVTPYNSFGDAQGVVDWKFTTEPEPIVLPEPTTPIYPLDGDTNVNIQIG